MMSTTQSIKAGLAIVAAGALVWLSVGANVRQSCVVQDSPYLALCDEKPAPGSAERLMELRRRIAANPGDSQAYVGLSYFPQDARRPAMVRAASELAPNDLNVLMARAALAIEENRLADAARDLVHLTEHYHQLTQAPAKALVQMILENHSALLQDHLTPGSHWFPLVLATMAEQKAPLAAASPLLPRAVESGALPGHRVGEFMAMLKREGNWVDAYGLWLAQHGGRAPMLYNASFDQPFQASGFDWEVTPERIGREGAEVAARPLGGHGRILEISFTGRSMPTPIVRQHVFLAPGRYRLTGQYMVSKLRTEGGLAWVVRCGVDAKQQPAGKSAALLDSQGQWRAFDFDIDVPDKCGPVASLQLEAFAPYEATVGMRGKAYFDAFELQKLPS
jgi:hypothetical protein